MPLLSFLLFLLLLPVLAAASPAPVTVMTIDGAITPASAAYFSKGLKRSVENGSSLVVLKMDTPGGLDTAMREIIKGILASPIPVATFVFPSGARAASAGTYILYASHIAAMAPGTNLGAATPVQIGMGGPESEPDAPPAEPQKDAPSDKAKPSPTGTKGTLSKKQISDSAAYIRSLAQLRGRNVDWAEEAVREAVSLTAEEALQLKVVDYVARDVKTLLEQAQGSKLAVGAKTVTLDTTGAELVDFDPDWRTQLLSVIASPSLALVLMMLGIYGLIFEFSNPGYVFPGVVGGICLLLALFAFQMLPINFAGLGLIALGMAFLVAEVFLPTSGVLGVGGVIAFVIGAIILVDTDIPGYGIPMPLILTLAVVSGLFVFMIVRMGVQSSRRQVVSGEQTLIGVYGEVLADQTVEGWASVQGEIWRVRSALPLAQGQRVRVTGIDGGTLVVEPQADESKGVTS
jgi:membrane-bound serine protease (ClpP class)